MKKPIPLDQKVRQRLAYVFLLPEVGQPIKGAARRLLERSERLAAALASLEVDLDQFEVDHTEWWTHREIKRAKREAKTPDGQRLVRWT